MGLGLRLVQRLAIGDPGWLRRRVDGPRSKLSLQSRSPGLFVFTDGGIANDTGPRTGRRR